MGMRWQTGAIEIEGTTGVGRRTSNTRTTVSIRFISEREEWRCVLVAHLKVCSVSERGPGGGRTRSSWLARGVGGGGQVTCASARIDSSPSSRVE